MKKLLSVLAIAYALVLAPTLAWAEAVPGKPAPAFEVKDAAGKTQKLSDYKGKWLVLEWFNKDCPYVKKHYEKSTNMQDLQKKYTAQGITWLTVISSVKGKQGHMTPAAATKYFKDKKSATAAILLDETGAMGKAYDAKVTPHMYIINPEGNVVYAGAIDSNDSSSADVIPKSKNYVAEALEASLAGKSVATTSTKPYGCSVKY